MGPGGTRRSKVIHISTFVNIHRNDDDDDDDDAARARRDSGRKTTAQQLCGQRLERPCTMSLFDVVNGSSVLRIAWLHIPKCGTSFGNTLVHFANQSLPQRASVGTDETGFMHVFNATTWFSHAGKPVFWMKDGNFGNHLPITDDVYSSWRGHFVGMFRNPALRAESAFRHFMPPMKPEHDVVARRKYADIIRGSSTKMLSGQAYGLSCIWWLKHGCNNALPDVRKALSRLDGFAFVGLVELYDLSICLFHVMFGGRCVDVEFSNTRPGVNHDLPVTPGAFTEWGGGVDGYDWRVYSEVMRIFYERLLQYRVDEDMCNRVCPSQAGSNRFASYRHLWRRL